MGFIAKFWFVWTCGALLGLGYVLYDQVRRMKLHQNSVFDSKTVSAQAVPESNVKMYAAGTVGWVSLTLLSVATVVNLIAKYQH